MYEGSLQDKFHCTRMSFFFSNIYIYIYICIHSTYYFFLKDGLEENVFILILNCFKGIEV